MQEIADVTKATYRKHTEETGGRNSKDNTKRMQDEKDRNHHLM